MPFVILMRRRRVCIMYTSKKISRKINARKCSEWSVMWGPSSSILIFHSNLNILIYIVLSKNMEGKKKY